VTSKQQTAPRVYTSDRERAETFVRSLDEADDWTEALVRAFDEVREDERRAVGMSRLEWPRGGE
jgi:hypothetical protein